MTNQIKNFIGGGADEVKDTSLERYREEYRKRFHDGDGTIGDRKNNFSTEDIYSKIEDFLISKILEVRKATEQKVREEIEKDYIEYILANSYGKKYVGKTPFWEWKQKAEVKDMRTWD